MFVKVTLLLDGKLQYHFVFEIRKIFRIFFVAIFNSKRIFLIMLPSNDQKYENSMNGHYKCGKIFSSNMVIPTKFIVRINGQLFVMRL